MWFKMTLEEQEEEWTREGLTQRDLLSDVTFILTFQFANSIESRPGMRMRRQSVLESQKEIR
jgi:hypothetical protein